MVQPYEVDPTIFTSSNTVEVLFFVRSKLYVTSSFGSSYLLVMTNPFLDTMYLGKKKKVANFFLHLRLHDRDSDPT